MTDSFTPASGDIGWAATGHADVAGNVGTSGACDDWLPACAATRATQSALERDANPTIDAASGDAVDAYDVSTFVQLDPVTTMYTLYEQKANVSSPARVGAASEQALRDALLNFDRDAGAWFLAQHVSTSRLLFQLGGACGAASGPNCRGSCGTCDDAAVRSRVDNHVNGAASNLAVDGEGDRGGACAPTLRASADDDTLVTTWFVSALDARRVSKPVVRFTDAAGGVLHTSPPRTSPPPTEWRGRRSDRRSPRTRARRVLTRASARRLRRRPERRAVLRWRGLLRGHLRARAARAAASAACGTNSYGCLDRVVARRPRRLPGTGAWAAYNDAVAAATALATSWRVDVSLSSATATPAWGDGALVGEVCCSRDDAGDDPFGNEFARVAGSSAGSGSACLEAALVPSPRVCCRRRSRPRPAS